MILGVPILKHFRVAGSHKSVSIYLVNKKAGYQGLKTISLTKAKSETANYTFFMAVDTAASRNSCLVTQRVLTPLPLSSVSMSLLLAITPSTSYV